MAVSQLAQTPNAIKVDTEAFWRDGYAIIRGVFSESEARALRQDLLDTAREDEATGRATVSPKCLVPRGDLLSRPRLRRFVLDARVLSIARQILGDRPVYFGDSDYSVSRNANDNPLGGGWHKDSRVADRNNLAGLDWQGRYSVVRFGLYLQDHAWHSGGLALRVGSHNEADTTSGKGIIAGTRPGDLVFWSHRTTHAGNAIRFRIAPSVKFPSWFEYRVPSRFRGWLIRGFDGPRATLFASFGLNDEHTHRYIEEFRTRDYGAEYVRHTRFGEEVWDEIRNADLDVIRPTPDWGTPA